MKLEQLLVVLQLTILGQLLFRFSHPLAELIREHIGLDVQVVICGQIEPLLHLLARGIVCRPQRRFGETVLEVVDDVGRLDYERAIVNECRHESFRVNAEILRRDILSLTNIDVVARPLEILFLEHHADSH